MDRSTQAVPGYFIWEVEGKPLVVHLHLDVVDRMSADVMRGFGAVPKRGAEVGGILLGTIEEGDRTTVRIEDFEALTCQYTQGPSFQLSEPELQEFDQAVRRCTEAAQRAADEGDHDGAQSYPVGYFRSNTREGMTLAPEDLEILAQHFPKPSQVALLIQPYATKVSQAGFFVREDGQFPEATPLEFPFRRREITGEDAPPRRSMYERTPRGGRSQRMSGSRHAEGRDYNSGPSFAADSAYGDSGQAGYAEAEQPPEGYYAEEGSELAAEPATAQQRKRSWGWIPISLIFLILGLGIGFQAATTWAPELARSGDPLDLSLNLSVARNGDNLMVRWNRDAVAVRAAQSGLLEIDDGGYTKPVDMEVADLQNGTVIYQNSSNSVRFRLIIYLNSRSTVTEVLEWRQ